MEDECWVEVGGSCMYHGSMEDVARTAAENPLIILRWARLMCFFVMRSSYVVLVGNLLGQGDDWKS